jgi:hypothetical protein
MCLSNFYEIDWYSTNTNGQPERQIFTFKMFFIDNNIHVLWILYVGCKAVWRLPSIKY